MDSNPALGFPKNTSPYFPTYVRSCVAHANVSGPDGANGCLDNALYPDMSLGVPALWDVAMVVILRSQ